MAAAGEAAPTELPLTAAERIEAWAGDPNFMTSLARGLSFFYAELKRLKSDEAVKAIPKNLT